MKRSSKARWSADDFTDIGKTSRGGWRDEIRDDERWRDSQRMRTEVGLDEAQPDPSDGLVFRKHRQDYHNDYDPESQQLDHTITEYDQWEQPTPGTHKSYNRVIEDTSTHGPDLSRYRRRRMELYTSQKPEDRLRKTATHTRQYEKKIRNDEDGRRRKVTSRHISTVTQSHHVFKSKTNETQRKNTKDNKENRLLVSPSGSISDISSSSSQDTWTNRSIFDIGVSSENVLDHSHQKRRVSLARSGSLGKRRPPSKSSLRSKLSRHLFDTENTSDDDLTIGEEEMELMDKDNSQVTSNQSIMVLPVGQVKVNTKTKEQSGQDTFIKRKEKLSEEYKQEINILNKCTVNQSDFWTKSTYSNNDTSSLGNETSDTNTTLIRVDGDYYSDQFNRSFVNIDDSLRRDETEKFKISNKVHEIGNDFEREYHDNYSDSNLFDKSKMSQIDHQFEEFDVEENCLKKVKNSFTVKERDSENISKYRNKEILKNSNKSIVITNESIDEPEWMNIKLKKVHTDEKNDKKPESNTRSGLLITEEKNNRSDDDKIKIHSKKVEPPKIDFEEFDINVTKDYKIPHSRSISQNDKKQIHYESDSAKSQPQWLTNVIMKKSNVDWEAFDRKEENNLDLTNNSKIEKQGADSRKKSYDRTKKVSFSETVFLDEDEEDSLKDKTSHKNASEMSIGNKSEDKHLEKIRNVNLFEKNENSVIFKSYGTTMATLNKQSFSENNRVSINQQDNEELNNFNPRNRMAYKPDTNEIENIKLKHVKRLQPTIENDRKDEDNVKSNVTREWQSNLNKRSNVDWDNLEKRNSKTLKLQIENTDLKYENSSKSMSSENEFDRFNGNKEEIFLSGNLKRNTIINISSQSKVTVNERETFVEKPEDELDNGSDIQSLQRDNFILYKVEPKRHITSRTEDKINKCEDWQKKVKEANYSERDWSFFDHTSNSNEINSSGRIVIEVGNKENHQNKNEFTKNFNERIPEVDDYIARKDDKTAESVQESTYGNLKINNVTDTAEDWLTKVKNTQYSERDWSKLERKDQYKNANIDFPNLKKINMSEDDVKSYNSEKEFTNQEETSKHNYSKIKPISHGSTTKTIFKIENYQPDNEVQVKEDLNEDETIIFKKNLEEALSRPKDNNENFEDVFSDVPDMKRKNSRKDPFITGEMIENVKLKHVEKMQKKVNSDEFLLPNLKHVDFDDVEKNTSQFNTHINPKEIDKAKEIRNFNSKIETISKDTQNKNVKESIKITNATEVKNIDMNKAPRKITDESNFESFLDIKLKPVLDPMKNEKEPSLPKNRINQNLKGLENQNKNVNDAVNLDETLDQLEEVKSNYMYLKSRPVQKLDLTISEMNNRDRIDLNHDEIDQSSIELSKSHEKYEQYPTETANYEIGEMDSYGIDGYSQERSNDEFKINSLSEYKHVKEMEDAPYFQIRIIAAERTADDKNVEDEIKMEMQHIKKNSNDNLNHMTIDIDHKGNERTNLQSEKTHGYKQKGNLRQRNEMNYALNAENFLNVKLKPVLMNEKKDTKSEVYFPQLRPVKNKESINESNKTEPKMEMIKTSSSVNKDQNRKEEYYELNRFNELPQKENIVKYSSETNLTSVNQEKSVDESSLLKNTIDNESDHEIMKKKFESNLNMEELIDIKKMYSRTSKYEIVRKFHNEYNEDEHKAGIMQEHIIRSEFGYNPEPNKPSVDDHNGVVSYIKKEQIIHNEVSLMNRLSMYNEIVNNDKECSTVNKDLKCEDENENEIYEPVISQSPEQINDQPIIVEECIKNTLELDDFDLNDRLENMEQDKNVYQTMNTLIISASDEQVKKNKRMESNGVTEGIYRRTGKNHDSNITSTLFGNNHDKVNLKTESNEDLDNQLMSTISRKWTLDDGSNIVTNKIEKVDDYRNSNYEIPMSTKSNVQMMINKDDRVEKIDGMSNVEMELFLTDKIRKLKHAEQNERSYEIIRINSFNKPEKINSLHKKYDDGTCEHPEIDENLLNEKELKSTQKTLEQISLPLTSTKEDLIGKNREHNFTESISASFSAEDLENSEKSQMESNKSKEESNEFFEFAMRRKTNIDWDEVDKTKKKEQKVTLEEIKLKPVNNKEKSNIGMKENIIDVDTTSTTADVDWNDLKINQKNYKMVVPSVNLRHVPKKEHASSISQVNDPNLSKNSILGEENEIETGYNHDSEISIQNEKRTSKLENQKISSQQDEQFNIKPKEAPDVIVNDTPNDSNGDLLSYSGHGHTILHMKISKDEIVDRIEKKENSKPEILKIEFSNEELEKSAQISQSTCSKLYQPTISVKKSTITTEKYAEHITNLCESNEFEELQKIKLKHVKTRTLSQESITPLVLSKLNNKDSEDFGVEIDANIIEKDKKNLNDGECLQQQQSSVNENCINDKIFVIGDESSKSEGRNEATKMDKHEKTSSEVLETEILKEYGEKSVKIDENLIETSISKHLSKSIEKPKIIAEKYHHPRVIDKKSNELGELQKIKLKHVKTRNHNADSKTPLVLTKLHDEEVNIIDDKEFEAKTEVLETELSKVDTKRSNKIKEMVSKTPKPSRNFNHNPEFAESSDLAEIQKIKLKHIENKERVSDSNEIAELQKIKLKHVKTQSKQSITPVVLTKLPSKNGNMKDDKIEFESNVQQTEQLTAKQSKIEGLENENSNFEVEQFLVETRENTNLEDLEIESLKGDNKQQDEIVKVNKTLKPKQTLIHEPDYPESREIEELQKIKLKHVETGEILNKSNQMDVLERIKLKHVETGERLTKSNQMDELDKIRLKHVRTRTQSKQSITPLVLNMLHDNSGNVNVTASKQDENSSNPQQMSAMESRIKDDYEILEIEKSNSEAENENLVIENVATATKQQDGIIEVKKTLKPKQTLIHEPDYPESREIEELQKIKLKHVETGERLTKSKQMDELEKIKLKHVRTRTQSKQSITPLVLDMLHDNSGNVNVTASKQDENSSNPQQMSDMESRIKDDFEILEIEISNSEAENENLVIENVATATKQQDEIIEVKKTLKPKQTLIHEPDYPESREIEELQKIKLKHVETGERLTKSNQMDELEKIKLKHVKTRTQSKHSITPLVLDMLHDNSGNVNVTASKQDENSSNPQQMSAMESRIKNDFEILEIEISNSEAENENLVIENVATATKQQDGIIEVKKTLKPKQTLIDEPDYPESREIEELQKIKLKHVETGERLTKSNQMDELEKIKLKHVKTRTQSKHSITPLVLDMLHDNSGNVNVTASKQDENSSNPQQMSDMESRIKDDFEILEIEISNSEAENENLVIENVATATKQQDGIIEVKKTLKPKQTLIDEPDYPESREIEELQKIKLKHVETGERLTKSKQMDELEKIKLKHVKTRTQSKHSITPLVLDMLHDNSGNVNVTASKQDENSSNPQQMPKLNSKTDNENLVIEKVASDTKDRGKNSVEIEKISKPKHSIGNKKIQIKKYPEPRADVSELKTIKLKPVKIKTEKESITSLDLTELHNKEKKYANDGEEIVLKSNKSKPKELSVDQSIVKDKLKNLNSKLDADNEIIIVEKFETSNPYQNKSTSGAEMMKNFVPQGYRKVQRTSIKTPIAKEERSEIEFYKIQLKAKVPEEEKIKDEKIDEMKFDLKSVQLKSLTEKATSKVMEDNSSNRINLNEVISKLKPVSFSEKEASYDFVEEEDSILRRPDYDNFDSDYRNDIKSPSEFNGSIDDIDEIICDLNNLVGEQMEKESILSKSGNNLSTESSIGINEKIKELKHFDHFSTFKEGKSEILEFNNIRTRLNHVESPEEQKKIDFVKITESQKQREKILQEAEFQIENKDINEINIDLQKFGKQTENEITDLLEKEVKLTSDLKSKLMNKVKTSKDTYKNFVFSNFDANEEEINRGPDYEIKNIVKIKKMKEEQKSESVDDVPGSIKINDQDSKSHVIQEVFIDDSVKVQDSSDVMTTGHVIVTEEEIDKMSEDEMKDMVKIRKLKAKLMEEQKSQSENEDPSPIKMISVHNSTSKMIQEVCIKDSVKVQDNTVEIKTDERREEKFNIITKNSQNSKESESKIDDNEISVKKEFVDIKNTVDKPDEKDNNSHGSSLNNQYDYLSVSSETINNLNYVSTLLKRNYERSTFLDNLNFCSDSKVDTSTSQTESFVNTNEEFDHNVSKTFESSFKNVEKHDEDQNEVFDKQVDDLQSKKLVTDVTTNEVIKNNSIVTETENGTEENEILKIKTSEVPKEQDKGHVLEEFSNSETIGWRNSEKFITHIEEKSVKYELESKEECLSRLKSRTTSMKDWMKENMTDVNLQTANDDTLVEVSPTSDELDENTDSEILKKDSIEEEMNNEEQEFIDLNFDKKWPQSSDSNSINFEENKNVCQGEENENCNSIKDNFTSEHLKANYIRLPNLIIQRSTYNNEFFDFQSSNTLLPINITDSVSLLDCYSEIITKENEISTEYIRNRASLRFDYANYHCCEMLDENVYSDSHYYIYLEGRNGEKANLYITESLEFQDNITFVQLHCCEILNIDLEEEKEIKKIDLQPVSCKSSYTRNYLHNIKNFPSNDVFAVSKLEDDFSCAIVSINEYHCCEICQKNAEMTICQCSKRADIDKISEESKIENQSKLNIALCSTVQQSIDFNIFAFKAMAKCICCEIIEKSSEIECYSNYTNIPWSQTEVTEKIIEGFENNFKSILVSSYPIHHCESNSFIQPSNDLCYDLIKFEFNYEYGSMILEDFKNYVIQFENDYCFDQIICQNYQQSDINLNYSIAGLKILQEKNENYQNKIISNQILLNCCEVIHIYPKFKYQNEETLVLELDPYFEAVIPKREFNIKQCIDDTSFFAEKSFMNYNCCEISQMKIEEISYELESNLHQTLNNASANKSCHNVFQKVNLDLPIIHKCELITNFSILFDNDLYLEHLEPELYDSVIASSTTEAEYASAYSISIAVCNFSLIVKNYNENNRISSLRRNTSLFEKKCLKYSSSTESLMSNDDISMLEIQSGPNMLSNANDHLVKFSKNFDKNQTYDVLNDISEEEHCTRNLDDNCSQSQHYEIDIKVDSENNLSKITNIISDHDFRITSNFSNEQQHNSNIDLYDEKYDSDFNLGHLEPDVYDSVFALSTSEAEYVSTYSISTAECNFSIIVKNHNNNDTRRSLRRNSSLFEKKCLKYSSSTESLMSNDDISLLEVESGPNMLSNTDDRLVEFSKSQHLDNNQTCDMLDAISEEEHYTRNLDDNCSQSQHYEIDIKMDTHSENYLSKITDIITDNDFRITSNFSNDQQKKSNFDLYDEKKCLEKYHDFSESSDSDLNLGHLEPDVYDSVIALSTSEAEYVSTYSISTAECNFSIIVKNHNNNDTRRSLRRNSSLFEKKCLKYSSSTESLMSNDDISLLEVESGPNMLSNTDDCLVEFSKSQHLEKNQTYDMLNVISEEEHYTRNLDDNWSQSQYYEIDIKEDSHSENNHSPITGISTVNDFCMTSNFANDQQQNSNIELNDEKKSSEKYHDFSESFDSDLNLGYLEPDVYDSVIALSTTEAEYVSTYSISTAECNFSILVKNHNNNDSRPLLRRNSSLFEKKCLKYSSSTESLMSNDFISLLGVESGPNMLSNTDDRLVEFSKSQHLDNNQTYDVLDAISEEEHYTRNLDDNCSQSQYYEIDIKEDSHSENNHSPITGISTVNDYCMTSNFANNQQQNSDIDLYDEKKSLENYHDFSKSFDSDLNLGHLENNVYDSVMASSTIEAGYVSEYNISIAVCNFSLLVKNHNVNNSRTSFNSNTSLFEHKSLKYSSSTESLMSNDYIGLLEIESKSDMQIDVNFDRNQTYSVLHVIAEDENFTGNLDDADSELEIYQKYFKGDGRLENSYAQIDNISTVADFKITSNSSNNMQKNSDVLHKRSIEEKFSSTIDDFFDSPIPSCNMICENVREHCSEIYDYDIFDNDAKMVKNSDECDPKEIFPFIHTRNLYDINDCLDTNVTYKPSVIYTISEGDNYESSVQLESIDSKESKIFDGTINIQKPKLQLETVLYEIPSELFSKCQYLMEIATDSYENNYNIIQPVAILKKFVTCHAAWTQKSNEISNLANDAKCTLLDYSCHTKINSDLCVTNLQKKETYLAKKDFTESNVSLLVLDKQLEVLTEMSDFDKGSTVNVILENLYHLTDINECSQDFITTYLATNIFEVVTCNLNKFKNIIGGNTSAKWLTKSIQPFDFVETANLVSWKSCIQIHPRNFDHVSKNFREKYASVTVNYKNQLENEFCYVDLNSKNTKSLALINVPNLDTISISESCNANVIPAISIYLDANKNYIILEFHELEMSIDISSEIFEFENCQNIMSDFSFSMENYIPSVYQSINLKNNRHFVFYNLSKIEDNIKTVLQNEIYSFGQISIKSNEDSAKKAMLHIDDFKSVQDFNIIKSFYPIIFPSFIINHDFKELDLKSNYYSCAMELQYALRMKIVNLYDPLGVQYGIEYSDSKADTTCEKCLLIQNEHLNASTHVTFLATICNLNFNLCSIEMLPRINILTRQRDYANHIGHEIFSVNNSINSVNMVEQSNNLSLSEVARELLYSVEIVDNFDDLNKSQIFDTNCEVIATYKAKRSSPEFFSCSWRNVVNQINEISIYKSMLEKTNPNISLTSDKVFLTCYLTFISESAFNFETVNEKRNEIIVKREAEEMIHTDSCFYLDMFYIWPSITQRLSRTSQICFNEVEWMKQIKMKIEYQNFLSENIIESKIGNLECKINFPSIFYPISSHNEKLIFENINNEYSKRLVSKKSSSYNSDNIKSNIECQKEESKDDTGSSNEKILINASHILKIKDDNLENNSLITSESSSSQKEISSVDTKNESMPLLGKKSPQCGLNLDSEDYTSSQETKSKYLNMEDKTTPKFSETNDFFMVDPKSENKMDIRRNSCFEIFSKSPNSSQDANLQLIAYPEFADERSNTLDEGKEVRSQSISHLFLLDDANEEEHCWFRTLYSSRSLNKSLDKILSKRSNFYRGKEFWRSQNDKIIEDFEFIENMSTQEKFSNSLIESNLPAHLVVKVEPEWCLRISPQNNMKKNAVEVINFEFLEATTHKKEVSSILIDGDFEKIIALKLNDDYARNTFMDDVDKKRYKSISRTSICRIKYEKKITKSTGTSYNWNKEVTQSLSDLSTSASMKKTNFLIHQQPSENSKSVEDKIDEIISGINVAPKNNDCLTLYMYTDNKFKSQYQRLKSLKLGFFTRSLPSFIELESSDKTKTSKQSGLLGDENLKINKKYSIETPTKSKLKTSSVLRETSKIVNKSFQENKESSIITGNDNYQESPIYPSPPPPPSSKVYHGKPRNTNEIFMKKSKPEEKNSSSNDSTNSAKGFNSVLSELLLNKHKLRSTSRIIKPKMINENIKSNNFDMLKKELLIKIKPIPPFNSNDQYLVEKESKEEIISSSNLKIDSKFDFTTDEPAPSIERDVHNFTGTKISMPADSTKENHSNLKVQDILKNIKEIRRTSQCSEERNFLMNEDSDTDNVIIPPAMPELKISQYLRNENFDSEIRKSASTGNIFSESLSSIEDGHKYSDEFTKTELQITNNLKENSIVQTPNGPLITRSEIYEKKPLYHDKKINQKNFAKTSKSSSNIPKSVSDDFLTKIITKKFGKFDKVSSEEKGVQTSMNDRFSSESSDTNTELEGILKLDKVKKHSDTDDESIISSSTVQSISSNKGQRVKKRKTVKKIIKEVGEDGSEKITEYFEIYEVDPATDALLDLKSDKYILKKNNPEIISKSGDSGSNIIRSVQQSADGNRYVSTKVSTDVNRSNFLSKSLDNYLQNGDLAIFDDQISSSNQMDVTKKQQTVTTKKTTTTTVRTTTKTQTSEEIARGLSQL